MLTNPFQLSDSCYWEPLQTARPSGRANDAAGLLILRMILSENRFPIYGIMRGAVQRKFPLPHDRWDGMGAGARGND
ncbi:hypothetical protein MesoLj113c_71990 [Mesorhizobium sp. 113-3-9]|nr:hypothetical protein MesoLj113c_71990 [Mesorhizobium sp. 113-3-9]